MDAVAAVSISNESVGAINSLSINSITSNISNTTFDILTTSTRFYRLLLPQQVAYQISSVWSNSQINLPYIQSQSSFYYGLETSYDGISGIDFISTHHKKKLKQAYKYSN